MPKTEDISREERRKKNHRFNTALYIAAAFLILLGVFIILRDQTNLFSRNSGEIPNVTFPPPIIIRNSETPLPTEKVDPGRSEEPTPEPTPEAPSPPVNIYFEGHDIAVAVIPVGVNDKGEMDTVPEYNIAGWYMYGAAPNEEGNCIIAGHNRYHGQKGLFSILHKGLKIGDRVCVTMENGEYAFYSVVSIERYKYNAVPDSVMSPGGETRLTLITCLGDFDYDLQMSKTRVVAICEPIK
ncbi:MAG: class F sortase [Clostridia bacterium]|nr:class F sortase [Clostridia bacterium]